MAKLSLQGAVFSPGQVRMLAAMTNGVLDAPLMQRALVEKGVTIRNCSNDVVKGLITLAEAGVDTTPIIGFRLYPLPAKGSKGKPALPEFE